MGLWGPQSDARYYCGHTFSPIFAGLPECRFSVPAPESHRSVAVLAPIKKRSSHSHIPSSRALSCSRLSGNNKSRHTNAYRLPAKDRPIPCGVASHSCNRLCNSKSKLSFTLDHCRQFRAVLEAAVFSLAYRRRCPAESRHPKFVKNVIQL